MHRRGRAALQGRVKRHKMNGALAPEAPHRVGTFSCNFFMPFRVQYICTMIVWRTL
jgi:hypothetical protein